MSTLLEGKTVLYIEDEPDLRESMRMLMEDEGATVVTYGNHKNAASFPKADIILTDNDTNRDGGELGAGIKYIQSLRAFNATDPNRNTPAILLTGRIEGVEAAEKLGIPALGKPVRFEVLSAKIQEVLAAAKDKGMV